MSRPSRRLLRFLLPTLVVVGFGGMLAWWSSDDASPDPGEIQAGDREINPLSGTRGAGWLAAREAHIAGTVWAKEMLAQQCGRTLEDLWDALNASANPLQVAAAFPVGEVVLGQWTRPQLLPHGIEQRISAAPGRTLSQTDWRVMLTEFEEAGWRLEQTEFRHNRFDPDPEGRPSRSVFYFSAHLTNALRPDRAVAEGDLVVDWQPQRTAGGGIQVKGINASQLALKRRPGPPPFPCVLNETIPPPASLHSIDPLILYDLDGDGLSEILLPYVNRWYRRSQGGDDRPAGLCRFPPGPIFTALVADFDSDGAADLLCARSEGLLLYEGVLPAITTRETGENASQNFVAPATETGRGEDADVGSASSSRHPSPGGAGTPLPAAHGAQGTARPAALTDDWQPFPEPERLAWLAESPLKNPMALTCGDVDRDGDLDVFLGQYKVPTMGNILRPWYYDANDGYPAYLLLNDGSGHFTDATETAGLEAKRGRRTYTASLADLDADGFLDLAVVSDFAGVDLYRNDGRGRFADVTRAWLAEPQAFGMAHAFADFNADGRLDFLMIGMNSPTVDRLEHLGLRRPGSQEDFSMRPRMAYGNRLFLARPGGGFGQTPMNDSIARSGWSWGCSAADFDNDAFPDVYIANGLQSKRSVRDFEPEFWLHDLYVDESVEDREAARYFMDKFDHTRGAGWSYGGYEKNRFYFGRKGESFLEAGHLMGLALEEDSRNVVTDDLDGDGRKDLIVTTFEVWPGEKQTLRVYRNTLSDTGHWIGFRFREEPGGPSPVGARVLVEANGRRQVKSIVTGDSHRSQHANLLHFGLGDADRVDRVEIQWPDGRGLELPKPDVGRYHVVAPPARAGIAPPMP